MTPQHFEVIDTRTIRPFKYPRLAHNGYLYHFHKKCTHHLRWKCNRVYSLKCPAVLRTNINYEQGHIVVDHEHVHGYDFIAIEALKTRINVVKQSSLFK
ncbi:putative protein phosphatase isoform X2 [Aphis craccivora]|uniref:FLYWCH-type domain-containing protein n=1 Tax=Aphis craccivora TaxID=307492 RepID=A0A6G0ZKT7_APHCR|nr:putative protein phosphatase isoform X2 [Aphis craccivora]